MSGRPWTAAEDATVTALYPLRSAQSIADSLGRGVRAIYMRANLLGLSKPEGWASECTRKRWAVGRHEKSREALAGGRGWNKGIKGSTGLHPNCQRTQFRKGHLGGAAAERMVPVGTLRIAEGQLQKKVNDGLPLQSRWVAVQRLVWEAANGPIPPGHVVVFKDGRVRTEESQITLGVLELISRGENMRRNSVHTRYPKEVALLVQLRGAINRQINKRAKA